MEDKKILKITENVSWTGVLDPDIRTFDIVMETKHGATYNSYFINAEKKTLVETVKDKFWDVYKAKIIQLCKPEELEYIIVNHTEPDHSGSLAMLLDLCPNATVIGSGNVIRYLNDLLNFEFRHQVVKDGDVIDLGNMKLKVIAAPNLHWPDSMYTYLEEEKVLFTCDSFGSHYCHPEMYDDKVGDFDAAFTYYFNVILKPFSKFMLKAIEKIRPLEIRAICTGHGPLLTTQWKKYVDLTEKYALEATSQTADKALVAYVSAYGKTAMLAEAIAEGIRQSGVKAEVHDIEKLSPGEMDQLVSSASAIVAGSPTINQQSLMQIYQLMAVISPLRDKGKPAGSFGSYGWSGEAQQIINNAFTALRLELIPDSVFVKFTPSEKDLETARAYGLKIGEAVKAKEVKSSCSLKK